MERTRAIGVEQMTENSKPLTVVLDKFARSQQYIDWSDKVNVEIILEEGDYEGIAKLAFEQGKLAFLEQFNELLLEELQNGSFQDRNSPIIKGYIYQRAIKRLKSQLSQDEAKK